MVDHPLAFLSARRPHPRSTFDKLRSTLSIIEGSLYALRAAAFGLAARRLILPAGSLAICFRGRYGLSSRRSRFFRSRYTRNSGRTIAVSGPNADPESEPRVPSAKRQASSPMFIRAISPSVSSGTRHKGLAYFAAGAVRSIEGTPWEVQATVRGTDDYRVAVTRHEDRFTASCTCPYFTDRDEICKHIWAVMLAAERRQLLGGDGLPLPGAFALNPDVDALDREPSTAAPSRAGRVPPGMPPTPWARLLKSVQQSLATNERDTPQPRFTNGEILYALGSLGDTAPDTIGLSVQFRQRKKNGEWGKPRPVTLSFREIEQLTNPDDREILSLLMGAGDHWGYQSQSYDFTYQVRTAYRLSGLVASRVLPLAVSTGRAYLAGAGSDTVTPLNWDDRGPWRFELTVTRSAADRSVTIDGALARGGERRALSEFQPLGAGCAIVGTTVMPIDAGTSAVWIEHLRRSGPVTVPADAEESLVEALARSGIDPEALPGDLRFEIVDATPQPRVSVARRSGGAGYYNRDDLDALADFDYAGTLVGMEPGSTLYDPSGRRLIRR